MDKDRDFSYGQSTNFYFDHQKPNENRSPSNSSSIPPPAPSQEYPPISDAFYDHNTLPPNGGSRIASAASRQGPPLPPSSVLDDEKDPQNNIDNDTKYPPSEYTLDEEKNIGFQNIPPPATEVKYSHNSRYNNVERMLISETLSKPVITVPDKATKFLGIPRDGITVNTLIQMFQIVLQIITITLCSQSLNYDDTEINRSVWSFLISQAAIIMSVSSLFVLRILNFSQNNCIFYSIICCCLTISAFGVCVGILMPADCTNSQKYCDIRKAVTSMVCVSTFVWLIDLVIFTTIFYIARLDIIPTGTQFNAPPRRDFSARSANNYRTPINVPQPPIAEDSEFTKRYIISENGLTEVINEAMLEGKKKVKIYTE
ncbi:MARVEL domain-containing protein ASCRUDRAFT_127851 [Ascoidea rubescens DSM 1968]|uniref:Uncharacterized protein n=1 Tax=Ascoidea rubescens DSM 1968 TaxID=1344418 RepID=A0A1D2VNL8_9ASCO|nr:hypothetical protein ASCRUDRAFT_127851 [Ascoidea rubescens DSM 1968]ODV63196.1 hypothetical protein ASCRUDRAFT_127851 [Ascoidea rubescens DSM 1968]